MYLSRWQCMQVAIAHSKFHKAYSTRNDIT